MKWYIRIKFIDTDRVGEFGHSVLDTEHYLSVKWSPRHLREQELPKWILVAAS